MHMTVGGVKGDLRNGGCQQNYPNEDHTKLVQCGCERTEVLAGEKK
jgi:hypothetical protein